MAEADNDVFPRGVNCLGIRDEISAIASVCDIVQSNATWVNLHDRCRIVSISGAGERALEWLFPAAVIYCQVGRVLYFPTESYEWCVASWTGGLIYTQVGGWIGREVGIYSFDETEPGAPGWPPNDGNGMTPETMPPMIPATATNTVAAAARSQVFAGNLDRDFQLMGPIRQGHKIPWGTVMGPFLADSGAGPLRPHRTGHRQLQPRIAMIGTRLYASRRALAMRWLRCHSRP